MAEKLANTTSIVAKGPVSIQDRDPLLELPGRQMELFRNEVKLHANTLGVDFEIQQNEETGAIIAVSSTGTPLVLVRAAKLRTYEDNGAKMGRDWLVPSDIQRMCIGYPSPESSQSRARDILNTLSTGHIDNSMTFASEIEAPIYTQVGQLCADTNPAKPELMRSFAEYVPDTLDIQNGQFPLDPVHFALTIAGTIQDMHNRHPNRLIVLSSLPEGDMMKA